MQQPRHQPCQPGALGQVRAVQLAIGPALLATVVTSCSLHKAIPTGKLLPAPSSFRSFFLHPPPPQTHTFAPLTPLHLPPQTPPRSCSTHALFAACLMVTHLVWMAASASGLMGISWLVPCRGKGDEGRGVWVGLGEAACQRIFRALWAMWAM